jgi:hypothetical protein
MPAGHGPPPLDGERLEGHPDTVTWDIATRDIVLTCLEVGRILVSMQATLRDLTDSRVAADRVGALAWLARRLVWEDRLYDLEVRRDAPTTLAGSRDPRAVRRASHGEREPTPVAKAS